MKIVCLNKENKNIRILIAMRFLKDIPIEHILTEGYPCAHVIDARSLFWSFESYPVLVIKKDAHGFILLDGHRRIKSLLNKKKTVCDVFCDDKLSSSFEIVEEIIKRNVFSMDVIDWIFLLKYSRKFQLLTHKNEKFLIENYTQLISKSFSKEHLFILLDVEDSLLEKYLLKFQKVHHFYMVYQYAKKFSDQWMHFFSKMQMNSNELKKILQFCQDIAKREDWSLQILWEELELSKFFKKKESPRKFYSDFFAMVWKKRYPLRYKSQKKMTSFLSSLKKPEQLTLNIPQNLEGSTVQFVLNVSHKKDLNNMVNWIKNNESKIEHILSWI